MDVPVRKSEPTLDGTQADVLARYADMKEAEGFWGQTILSWEGGRLVHFKETRNLKPKEVIALIRSNGK